MNMHVSGNQMNGDADKTTASRGGRQVQGNVLDFFPEKVFPEKFLQKISDLDSTTKNDKRMTLPDFQSDDC